MKKIFLLLAFSVTAYSQINFTTFPKIAFGDWYFVAKPDTLPGHHWADSGYYYHRHKELGFNYVWGSATDTTILNRGQGLKILHDLNFNNPDPYVFNYCWSAANEWT
jgi:hypothetical protein